MIDPPMSWALAAKMTIWMLFILAALFVLAVLVGRLMRKRGYEYYEPEDDEEGGQTELETDRDYATRLARDAARPVSDKKWQERARKAEGLFDDNDPNTPPRAS